MRQTDLRGGETKKMTEIWKDIKGFEDSYQISNLGRIKSKARLVNRFSTRWGKDASYTISGSIKEGYVTRDGYLFALLYKDGACYPKRLNRLVAEAFKEDYSEDKEVHHIDGNVTNNKADNLECLTKEEHHSKHTKTIVIGTNGKNTVVARLIDIKEYGFDPANVSRCCKAAELEDGHPRKSKYATHKGYKWRYKTKGGK